MKRALSLLVTLSLILAFILVSPILTETIRNCCWPTAKKILFWPPFFSTQVGIYENRSNHDDQGATVLIYNGQSKALFGLFPVGGQTFSKAAQNPKIHYTICADSENSAVELIREFVETNPKIRINEIGVLDHGTTASQFLGNDRLGHNFFSNIKEISKNNPNLTVFLFGCYVAEGEVGKDYIAYLSAKYGLTVYADSNVRKYQYDKNAASLFTLNRSTVLISKPGMDTPLSIDEYNERQPDLKDNK